MAEYTSPDGFFRVPSGSDASGALAQAMKAQRMEREADNDAYAERFWADWSAADEAQFQADMKRIDAQIREERRVARALAGGIEPTMKAYKKAEEAR